MIESRSFVRVMCVYVASHRWYPLSFVQVSLQPSDVQESEFDRCRILVKPALFVSVALARKPQVQDEHHKVSIETPSQRQRHAVSLIRAQFFF